ncbi:hypothetical protein L226DRAFT_274352 [Lentinus tigrinus ALCF2SS1-7]|uniref:uncharacterized protein n=1 Tax=Lentinus tigrinus ALCF2SS1-7 TaxID=1328758 RepID=UPI001166105C|nr:hypothetical protein L226DRAFT_274352 [Lentinus tigrinus ALCF2SS1-7]
MFDADVECRCRESSVGAWGTRGRGGLLLTRVGSAGGESGSGGSRGVLARWRTGSHLGSVDWGRWTRGAGGGRGEGLGECVGYGMGLACTSKRAGSAHGRRDLGDPTSIDASDCLRGGPAAGGWGFWQTGTSRVRLRICFWPATPANAHCAMSQRCHSCPFQSLTPCLPYNILLRPSQQPPPPPPTPRRVLPAQPHHRACFVSAPRSISRANVHAQRLAPRYPPSPPIPRASSNVEPHPPRQPRPEYPP